MSGLNNNEFRLHQFSVEVCDIIRQIPAGKVLTYGQIARLAGFSNYSRWVGKVLSHHPGTAALPCIGWSTAKDGQLLTGPDKKAYLPPKESLFNRMVVSI